MTLSADSFVLCVLIVWYGLTAVTVFKGQIRHLPTTSRIDCIDKISKEQFLACSLRRRSMPPGPPPPPLSCGSSAGSFQPAPCMLQHRRWYLAAWMMLAVQAAVPCSRVRELPDRMLDYRTTAIKVHLVSQVRLQSWRAQNRSSHVRDEEKRSTKKWRLCNRATQLQGLLCVLSFRTDYFVRLLRRILCPCYAVTFCSSWYTWKCK